MNYCQYNNNGVISVTLQDWNNSYDPSTASSTQNIIIQVPPNPISSFTATPSSGPAPVSVQFDDTSSNNPTTWIWNFGDGAGSNQQNPSHNYTISGVYTVTMQASSSTTCHPTNPASSTITVLSPSPPEQQPPPLSPQSNRDDHHLNDSFNDNGNRTNNPASRYCDSNGNRHTLGILLYPKTDRHDNSKDFHANSNQYTDQKSPFGIEFSILAISAAILIVRSQYRKP